MNALSSRRVIPPLADLNTGRYNKLIEIEESQHDNDGKNLQVSSQLEDTSSYIQAKKQKLDQIEDSSLIL